MRGLNIIASGGKSIMRRIAKLRSNIVASIASSLMASRLSGMTPSSPSKTEGVLFVGAQTNPGAYLPSIITANVATSRGVREPVNAVFVVSCVIDAISPLSAWKQSPDGWVELNPISRGIA